MPTLPPALVSVAVSIATLFAFGVFVEVLKRRGFDPVGRAATAINGALPATVAPTGGAA